MKTYGGVEVELQVFNLDTIWGEQTASSSGDSIPIKETFVPIGSNEEWIPEPV
jgi:hypothetical protein